MYKCYDCGCVFEEPERYSEDRTPGGGFEGGSFIEYYYGCTSCAGAFGKAVVCEVCDNIVFENECEFIDNTFICEKCLEEELFDD